MNTLDFLQNIVNRSLELKETKLQGERPKWHLSYKMVINPKVKCPYCGEWVETGRVWVIDEDDFRVRKLWFMDGQEIGVEGCHPHVGTAGKICMGDARNVSDALFAGLSDDAFTKPFDWLPDKLGHCCDELEEHKDRLREEEDENYFYCDSCDGRYHNDDQYYSEPRDGYYCRDCYYEGHTDCQRCGDGYLSDSEDLAETPDGDIWCRRCFDRSFTYCEGCINVVYLSDVVDGLCSDCQSKEEDEDE